MAWTTNGDSRLYYEVHGAGPALVLCHGVGGNHASWFYQITSLAARFRLIVPDARGFGNSSDAEGLGRGGFAGDIEAVLAAEKIDKVILVAQSMGGGTGLDFTCRHPDRVRALVMADSLVGFALPDDVQAQMREMSARTANLPQVERVLGETTRRERPAMATLYTEIASFNKAGLRTLAGQQATHGVDELARTGVPVLFIAGAEDVLFPPSIVQRVQARVPGSRFVEIAKSGHSAYFESPDAFDRAITTWLHEIGADAGA
jgi:pimeloyl-ACP methyl ester carboxylesterase